MLIFRHITAELSGDQRETEPKANLNDLLYFGVIMSKYETGSKQYVFNNMIECALRDKEALVDGYEDYQGKPLIDFEEEHKEAIAEIRDFKKIAKLKI